MGRTGTWLQSEQLCSCLCRKVYLAGVVFTRTQKTMDLSPQHLLLHLFMEVTPVKVNGMSEGTALLIGVSGPRGSQHTLVCLRLGAEPAFM